MGTAWLFHFTIQRRFSHEKDSEENSEKDARSGTATPKPQRDYTPEFAEWTENAMGEYTFNIREVFTDPNAGSYSDTLGGMVATVTVSDSFTPKSARKIARLMAYAPELWQALKRARTLAHSHRIRFGRDRSVRKGLESSYRLGQPQPLPADRRE